MLEIPQLLTAKSPALLFSGGKDSLLLLDIARSIRPDVTVIHFYNRLHPQVERIFRLWELELLSWPPAHQYFIPWDNDLALVSEYSFGDARLPVVTGITRSKDACDVEGLSKERKELFEYPFDLTLWGYKRRDERHPVMGQPFHREFQLGPTRKIAPLYSWSDEDVLGAIEYRKIPYEPFADEVKMCTKCSEGLSGWNAKASLEFFAKRFGFQENAA